MQLVREVIKTMDATSTEVRNAEEDFLYCYRVFLGRHTEHDLKNIDVYQINLAEFISQIIHSNEFKDRILNPILKMQKLSGIFFDLDPTDDIIEWISRLPLEERSVKKLSSTRDWSTIYLTIFTDDVFTNYIPGAKNFIKQILISELINKNSYEKQLDELRNILVNIEQKISNMEHAINSVQTESRHVSDELFKSVSPIAKLRNDVIAISNRFHSVLEQLNKNTTKTIEKI